MKFKMSRRVFFTGVLVLSLHFGAWAAPLPFGDNPISGTSEAAEPTLAGLVLEDVFAPYDFSGAGATVRGVVESRVVRSTLNGTLDFYWRVIPDADSSGGIDALRMVWSAGVILDANWRTDSLGMVAPDTARNFAILPGGAVNFLFSDPGVGPTESSKFFFLRTDATEYDASGFFDLLCAPLGCASPEFSTFSPVPEPSTIWVLACGVLCFFARTFFGKLKKQGP